MKKELKKYNEKRDFSITREPKGRKEVSKKKKGLIFVVQEHHASHLHWDFRLEIDGVLKSWAVPKGPFVDPKDPKDKRLAMMVEDHPLEYATFHGTIPKGEYGAGKVFIWDHGTYEAIGDVHKSLKKGNLKFKLSGKKLKGEFALVQMPSAGKNAWLLIKHKQTKNNQDPWPGFVSSQLCLTVDSPPKEANYIHEIKFDGYRVQPHIKDGVVKIFTRHGHDWSEKFPMLIKAISDLQIKNAIFDGEAVVQDKTGRTKFGLLQDALSRKDDSNIKLFLFDCLYLNGEDLRDLPLKERKEKLKTILPSRHKIVRYTADVMLEAESFFELTCKHNLEGIVSKNAEAPYRKGRGRDWCKTRCEKRQELVIGGYTTEKGSRGAELGALLLGVYDRKKFRYVGKVGTGFNRQSLKELKEKVKKFEQARSAFDLKSPKGKEIHWLRPKLVAEVSFTEWTMDKALRHPVFVGLREDKPVKDVVMEKEIHLPDTGVILTHPDKVLFKKENISKQEIADYYQKIAEKMLPFIKDRPLSLVRCPQGTKEHCFYQKHPGPEQAPPELFTYFKVKEKSALRFYIALNSKEAIKHLVQMNAFEIHTWNSHYQTIDRPDQIVMDLDPAPDVAFKEVVKAARELKKILDKLKLKNFVKTTGGKGLHVHVPILPFYTWEEVTAFAKVLADEMISRNPKMYLAKSTKEKRKGKIFLDFWRNKFGATAIAPYSLRAKETSSVAMPLEWSELARLKSADQFTMKKALAKIKARKKDPWKDFFKLKQKIKILEQKRAA